MEGRNVYDYLKQFEKYGFVPASEVNGLVQKAKAGDRKAIDRIVCSHQRFIFSTAKKYGFWKSGTDFDVTLEIMSAGNVGLLDAIRRFDAEKGAPFLSCAEFGIRNALGEAFRKGKDKNQVLVEPETFDLCENERQKSVENELIENETVSAVQKSMQVLNSKERFILVNHFGLGGKKISLTKIGEKLSLTKQRCQQIEKDAFRKILETGPISALREAA